MKIEIPLVFIPLLNYLPLYIFEFIALLCSFFTLYPENRKQRPLLLIMIIVAVAETIGAFLYPVNYFVFSISITLVVMNFFSLFYISVERPQHQFIIKYMAGAFLFFAIINIIFIQNTMMATNNFILAAILLTLCVVFYFIELLNNPKKITLYRDPIFWVGTGIILYYLPKSAVFISWKSLSTQEGMSFRYFYDDINLVISGLFYINISIACICKLIPQRSSKSKR